MTRYLLKCTNAEGGFHARARPLGSVLLRSVSPLLGHPQAPARALLVLGDIPACGIALGSRHGWWSRLQLFLRLRSVRNTKF